MYLSIKYVVCQPHVIKMEKMLSSLSSHTEHSINKNALNLNLKILSLNSIPSISPTIATRIFFAACLLNASIGVQYVLVHQCFERNFL